MEVGHELFVAATSGKFLVDACNGNDHKHHYESRVVSTSSSSSSYHHQSTRKKASSNLLQRPRITFDNLLTPLHKRRGAETEKTARATVSLGNYRSATSIINRIEENDVNTSNNSWMVPRSENRYQNGNGTSGSQNITIKDTNPIHLPLHTIVTPPDILSEDILVLRDMNPAQTCDVNISMALTYLNRSMFQSAINRSTESIRRHPHSFLPNFIRGICHYRLNHLMKAKVDFTVCCNYSQQVSTTTSTNDDKTERQEYDKALAFFNRSLVWMKMNETEKAMDDINRAIEMYDNEKSFFSNRALLFRKKGNFEAAQYDYRTVRRMEADEKIKIEMDDHTSPLKRDLTQTVTKEQGSPNKALLRRKTIIRRHDLIGNKSPGAKRPRSELDLKTSLYGYTYSALTCPPHKRTKTQLEILVKESRMMSAFSHLDTLQLKTLWQFLEYRSYPSEARLFEEGDVAEDYMILWSGSVSARVEMRNSIIRHSDNVAKALAMEREITVNTMKAGEAIMLEDGVRKASCVTEEPSEILLLKKEFFQQTFHVFLQKSHDEKVDFLSSTFPFLSHWEKGKLDELAHLCRETRYHRGETVVRQGDQANNRLFFVKTGMLSLERKLVVESDDSSNSRAKHIQPHHVATVSSGDIFGEATVLDSTRETIFQYSIQSETLSILYTLDRIQLNLNHWDEETTKKLMERSIKIQDDSVLERSYLQEKKFKKRSALIVSKTRYAVAKKKNMNKRYIR